METLQVLNRSEMKKIQAGYIQDGCSVAQITLTINGNCVGSVCCDGDCYQIPCCSDFGQDVGWCN